MGVCLFKRVALCQGEILYIFIHFGSPLTSIYLDCSFLVPQRLIDLNCEQKYTDHKTFVSSC